MSIGTTGEETRSAVQEKYGAAARQVRASGSSACCDPGLRCCDPITTNLYDEAEKSGLIRATKPVGGCCAPGCCS